MDVLSSKIVTTRKPHECVACTRIIPKGRSMIRSTVKDGGELYTNYECSACNALISMGIGVCPDDHTYDYGCMIEECEAWGVDTPEELLEQAKLKK